MANTPATTVEELAEALRNALPEMGDKAPIYLYMGNQLYGLDVQVNPKGKFGPGSVLLSAVPLPPR